MILVTSHSTAACTLPHLLFIRLSQLPHAAPYGTFVPGSTTRDRNDAQQPESSPVSSFSNPVSPSEQPLSHPVAPHTPQQQLEGTNKLGGGNSGFRRPAKGVRAMSKDPSLSVPCFQLHECECPTDPVMNLAQGQLALLCYGEQPGAALPCPGGCPALGTEMMLSESSEESNVLAEISPSILSSNGGCWFFNTRRVI